MRMRSRYYVMYSDHDPYGGYPVCDRRLPEWGQVICRAISRRDAEKIRNALNDVEFGKS